MHKKIISNLSDDSERVKFLRTLDPILKPKIIPITAPRTAPRTAPTGIVAPLL